MSVGRKIESWDNYVTRGDFFQIMIKLKMDAQLAEELARNNYKLRVAVKDADTRYNGVYYAVAEFPNYNDPSDPVVYLVLWDTWKGYPSKLGYVATLGQDQFPGHISNWQTEVSIAKGCGIYASTGKPCHTFGGNNFVRMDTTPKYCCNNC